MRKAYEPEKAVKEYNRKDTKRWCKGVIDREHEGEWRFLPPWHEDDRDYKRRYATLVCRKCGKHLRTRCVNRDGSIEFEY